MSDANSTMQIIENASSLHGKANVIVDLSSDSKQVVLLNSYYF